IAKLIPLLQEKGYRVAVIKHDGHGHYKEAEGHDSARYIGAGADYVVVSGKKAKVQVTRQESEPTLEALINELPPTTDIVLVEGYKSSPIAKIAVMLQADQAAVL